ncbi:tetratricopeptide repeat protein [Streptomyces sp. NPDC001843]|uniref:tetratricopeptide repeat protein n=1 Tax=Streptomyces sp. NPDC001843 TaxID=3364617 RepID=UPI0036D184BA
MQTGDDRPTGPDRYHDHVDFRNGQFHGPVSFGPGCEHAPHEPTAVSTLPTVQHGFTGRERELGLLLEGLRPSGDTPCADSPVMWAVTGLGGIGKTTLALQAAQIAKDKGWFTGGTLFLDLAGYEDTPVTPAQAVMSLLYALDMGGAHLPSEEVDPYGVYRGKLARLADLGKRVLLLLDNVCEPSQLPPLLPGGAAHRVLFTSRESHPSLAARELSLGPLCPQDSAELIARALRLRQADDERPEREAEAVRELTRLCGHLPLALQIAAALLSDRPSRRDVASLVDELHSRTDLTDTLRSQGVDQYGRPLSLAPVFEACVRRLPEDRARALYLLAQVPCADYGTDTAAEIMGLREHVALDVLDDLARAHLVTWERHGDGTAVRWGIHDLVRSYAAAPAASGPRLAEEARTARARARAHYHRRAAHCDRHMPVPVHDPSPAAAARRDTALAWFDSERTNLLAAVQWPDEGDPQARVGLALHLAGYLRWRRFYDDWAAVSRIARAVAQRLGDDHAEATACNHLGNALSRGGHPAAALEPLTHAAHLFRRIADPTCEGMAWNNLGLAHRRTGHHDVALATHLRARDRFRALRDEWNEGRAQHNLGLALDHMGRHAEAATALRQACELHQAHDRIFHGDSLNSLGCALHAAGRVEEAVTALEGSLRIREEYDNWYATVQTQYNLARSLEAAGRQAEAVRIRVAADETCALRGVGPVGCGHHY